MEVSVCSGYVDGVKTVFGKWSFGDEVAIQLSRGSRGRGSRGKPNLSA